MVQNAYDNTKEIQDVLLHIGIPANLSGFIYITSAVQLVLLDSSELHHIVKRLYVDVANNCNSTPQRVERAIRHAIEVAWTYGDLDYIDDLFKSSVNPLRGQPTNSQLIARLYYYFINNCKL